jgi:hypothetical protein
MINRSPRAAWLFSRVTALGPFQRDLPIQSWCATGITAVRHEDCGPCGQFAVTMTDRAGVSPAFLRAVLADNPDAMPPARIYPTVKYALGHGEACMRIVVGGTPVLFDHSRVPAPANVAVHTP